MSRDIPTEAQAATACLENFEALRRLVNAPDDEVDIAEAIDPAVGFVVACNGLRSKFPTEARNNLDDSLPFTDLETRLLQGKWWREDEDCTHALVLRLALWASFNTITIPGRNPSCGRFLHMLWPSLITSDERDRVTDLIDLYTPTTATPSYLSRRGRFSG